MRTAALLVLLLALATGAGAQEPAPGEIVLLTPERAARLAPAQRDAWTRYLARSAVLRERDRAAVRSELAALGRDRWIPAPVHSAIYLGGDTTAAWMRTDAARRVAENVVSFQTPAGGWSKRMDLTRAPRQPGQSYAAEEEWIWIGTFDNDATIEQMRFLARAYEAHRVPAFRDSYLRALRYLLDAQFPTGCWPQVYPLQGSYHDAVTLNDDAMLRVIQLLREAASDAGDLVPHSLRAAAREGARRGIDCILDLQVVDRGQRTVWSAQHDPLTGEPTKARAYEHPSLSAHESASILLFFMGLESPDARVVEAVHAGVGWLREYALWGLEYRGRDLVRAAGAPPLWARFYELGSYRPIFSNRDSVVRYRWEELEEERRNGYAWFTYRPVATLARYEQWRARHPRVGG